MKKYPTPNSLSIGPLVQILARVDAMFLPPRPGRGVDRVVLYEQQQKYLKVGLHYSAGIGVDARKDAQLDRDALAAAGLVRLRQIRSDRTVAIQLTPRGEAIARAAVELPSLSDSIAALDELYERAQEDDATKHAGFVWVREAIMAGTQIEDVGDEARQMFAVVEQIMLPSLIRGWALANSDIDGHCWYCLNPAKFTQQPSQAIKPPPAITTPRPSAALRRLYFVEGKAELSRLAAVTAEGQDIGMIPMPASPITRGQGGEKNGGQK